MDEPFVMPIMDETDALRDELHEIQRQCAQWVLNSVLMIRKYRGNRDFALDCWCLSLGEVGWPIVGVKSQSELASKYLKPNGKPMTKANVCKLINKFQGPGFLRLPPAGGQRGLAGRQTMSEKRNGQLKK